jgi:hypothetical protein
MSKNDPKNDQKFHKNFTKNFLQWNDACLISASRHVQPFGHIYRFQRVY